MKKWLTLLFYLFLISSVGFIISLSFYLFYFTDCDEVKAYWMVTQIPGRCI